jgi:hypothetical protein
LGGRSEQHTAALAVLAKRCSARAGEGLWVLRVEVQVQCCAALHELRAVVHAGGAPEAPLHEAHIQHCAAELSRRLQRATAAILPVIM